MKNIIKYLFFALLVGFNISCNNDDDDITELADPANTEHKYLRILVSDEVTKELSLVTPFTEEVVFFNAEFAKSAVYTTESGRFASILHRADNLTQTFDSGFEFHGDHVDVKGTPKFGAMRGTSMLPTHFKSKKGELMTFNDGDGTLSVGKESDIHNPGATLKSVNAGVLAHHGAMATFSNGTHAITEKDNSITGSLPERVKIINAAGATVYASTIATRGIHGNASDGTYALFGSASGILVVGSDGIQKLIPVPTDFGTAWFGTILETNMAGKFIGYTAAKGAYLIDVLAETVKPIFESSDVMQCKVSYNNSKLGILLHSGDLKIFDILTASEDKSGSVISSTLKTSSQKPQLILTERFAYITSPTTGELVQVSLKNMSNKKTHKVSATPYRLTFMGFENSIDH